MRIYLEGRYELISYDDKDYVRFEPNLGPDGFFSWWRFEAFFTNYLESAVMVDKGMNKKLESIYQDLISEAEKK